MQIERTKNAVKNSFSGLIFRVVCLLFPFAIRTILIKKLGIEYAGLGSLFTSLLQVLSLSELGFSTVVAFAMYKPVAEDDKPLVCALLGMIRKVYYIVGAVILIVGLAITPFLPDGCHPPSRTFETGCNLPKSTIESPKPLCGRRCRPL